MAGGTALSRVIDALPSNSVSLSLLGLLILALWSFKSYYLLRHVPGPFAAAISNLPRVSWILSNRAHDIHIDLHRHYGKLVRFGPNMVSVGDPAEIPNLYSFTAKFAKVRRAANLTLSQAKALLTLTLSLSSTGSFNSTPKANQYPLSSQHRTKICTACSRNRLQASTR
jgi:hypothetical protein